MQLSSLSSSRSTGFLFSKKIQVIVYLFVFLYFHCIICRNGKIYLVGLASFFLCINTLSGLRVGIRWSVCIAKSQWILCANKWLMLNWIIIITLQYLKPFWVLGMTLNCIWWWGIWRKWNNASLSLFSDHLWLGEATIPKTIKNPPLTH